MEYRKKLILLTATIALFAGAAIMRGSFEMEYEPLAFSCPTFGNVDADVEVVVFEDFKCYGCREFSEEMLPELESKYLDSDQIQLKIVPIGYLQGSKMLANAALEVYEIAPERFFSFTELLFDSFDEDEVEGLTNEDLLSIAKEVGGIDLQELKACIDHKCHYDELDHYLEVANNLMKNHIRIPAIFINGEQVKNLDLEEIKEKIEEAQS